MKRIDSHLHLAEIVAGYCRRGESRAIGNGKAQWGNGEIFQLIPEYFGDMRNFPAEKALELMNANEVEKAVLMHGSLYGFQNMYHYRLMQEYPGKFCASCTVDPFMGEHLETLRHYLEDLKFHLVKFEISAGGGLMGCHDAFALDSERMMKIYELIEKNAGVLALDVGDISQASHQPGALANIADSFPGLKIVICHLLAPLPEHMNEWRASLNLLKKDNVWFDISSMPKIVENGTYPYVKTQGILREAADILGADRLIWGTDAPFALTHAPEDTYEHLSDYLEKTEIFSKEELENIYYNNANHVYFE